MKLLIPSTVQCFILSTPAFIKVIMTSQWFSQLHSAALTQLTTPSFLKFPPPLISGTLHHLVYLLLLSCVSSTLNGFSSFSHILHATISQDFSLPPSVGLPNHFNHSHQQPPLNLSGGSHQHHKFAMFEVKFFSSNSQFLTSLFLLIVSPLLWSSRQRGLLKLGDISGGKTGQVHVLLASCDHVWMCVRSVFMCVCVNTYLCVNLAGQFFQNTQICLKKIFFFTCSCSIHVLSLIDMSK